MGNTIIVHSQNDKRLIAFNDSVAGYNFGLWQLEHIKTRTTDLVGEYVYKEALKYREKFSERYNTHAVSLGKTILLFYSYDKNGKIMGKTTWTIGIFKKPVDTVLFRVQSIDNYVKEIESRKYIMMPSGSLMSKDDFIARYGKEVYNRITNEY